MHKLKEATLKAMIVLVPTYTAAYLTEKMVWVVPTLAAAGFFAGTISLSGDNATQRRIEEDIEETIETSLDEDGADG
jgi:hypothetical protein